ncbi:MAG TPA: S9 family peptidase [Acidimicrobiia bacterium]|nr:S9 family peptidase [Acidimicrobiia bacterium]
MTLTPEKMWAIPRVGAPAAVGDERLIVPVTTYEPATDRSTTTLWRIDTESGAKRPFASGEISGVAVTKDGSSIAYLKKVEDHKQVHVQPIDGGEGRRVTDLPLGAVGVKWVPDGRLVALATLWAEHPELDATANHERDEHVTARATENAVYQYWDTWLDHVYHPVIVEPATGEVTDLTPGSTRFWRWPNTADPMDDIDVSPDGSLIAFCVDDSEAPHRQLSWSLFLMEMDGSGLHRLDEAMPGNSHRPIFTPDGSSLVFGYQAEPDFYASRMQIIRHELATGEQQSTTEGWDRSPTEWVFDHDGRLIVGGEDQGRARLWSLAQGRPQPLTEEGWCSSPTVSSAGIIYAVGHALDSPPEVVRVGDDGAVRTVTDFTVDALDQVELGAVREIEFAGGDGSPIQMWLVDPPGADPASTQPLVHLIHGGPHGVFGNAWHWRWNAQILASAGYRVAMVNFHGSTGWGEDFTTSIHGAWGDLPHRDIEAATDTLVERGLADPDRMAVTGGSYGGYLVAWITSQTNRYACAIAHAAVTNLNGMYASDVTYGRARAYGAEVWDDRQAIERWSPAAHAAGYATPTLVIHGHRDARVPVTQGLELYGVLVAKGVPARLVSYPNENHWILSRANSIRWYEEFLGWLERWI